MRKTSFSPIFLGILALSVATLSRAAENTDLISNGNMEVDSNADGWPDGWPNLTEKGGTWGDEDGNHFIRLKNTQPGKLIMLYKELRIPKDTVALKLTWRERVSNLQLGAQSWFDARIMLEFMDGARQKVHPAPNPPYTQKDTDGWVSRSIKFAVPQGAATLKFMPSLLNVKSGTFEIDDIQLEPISSEELNLKTPEEQAKLEKRAKALQVAAAERFAQTGNLIANGNMEMDSKGANSPDGWPNLRENSSLEREEGNAFYRLINTQPGKTVLAYRDIPIPLATPALEVSVRWRVSNLKPGSMPWHDARIMFDIKDAKGQKMKTSAQPIYAQRDTKEGWETRTVQFLVPDGAASLEFMPTLFEVESGTLDLDDIMIRPIDPAPVIAAAQAAQIAREKAHVPTEKANQSAWPTMLKVSENQIVDAEGGLVWLQGLNVPSLEWSATGEHVHKSVVVGIEDWGANVIRLPVKEDFWFGRKQSDGGQSYRAIVDQAITLAANRGAYVVLDLHRYRAPTEAFVEFWKDAASRYKNHPAVLFDLLNEPHDTTWEVWRDGGWVGDKKTADQATFLSEEERVKSGFESVGMQALLDAVRSTGAMNVVVVGGLDYAYELDGILDGYALEDSEGNGIIYSCHIYPWKSGWQKYLLDAAAKHPILLGEVGADSKRMGFVPLSRQEDAETWVPAILGLIQQHKLNWTGWCFHPSASPRMLFDWDYTPTPFWGEPAKSALHGKHFAPPEHLR